MVRSLASKDNNHIFGQRIDRFCETQSWFTAGLQKFRTSSVVHRASNLMDKETPHEVKTAKA